MDYDELRREVPRLGMTLLGTDHISKKIAPEEGDVLKNSCIC